MSRVSANIARKRRHARIRARVVGTPGKPRLCVFRSLSNIYAQVIDDAKGVTVASAGSLDAGTPFSTIEHMALVVASAKKFHRIMPKNKYSG